MPEVIGPETYRQDLESGFELISPNCKCTPSKALRARGVRLVLDGIYPKQVVEQGLEAVMQDCPTSKAVSMCCEVVQKCTNVEFISVGPEVWTELADAAITEVAFARQSGQADE